MLSWLKRRAKLTINNRYLNLFRSNINSSMLVTDNFQVNDHSLKLTVFNTEGRDYRLDVSSLKTVDQIKAMAFGHFFGPRSGESYKYRLVVLRGARPLSDDNALHFEKLEDNDVLLLVERRKPEPVQLADSSEDVSSPSSSEINEKTKCIPRRNDNRDIDSTNPSVDIEFRRILVTMIEASVRLISADPDSKEVFNQILDKLEKRHRPRIDRISLRQLVEMGFDEAKATKALQAKRSFNEAVEWLLEEGNLEENELTTSDQAGKFSDSSVDSKSALENQDDDPAKKILAQFIQYRKKWFQPNHQILQKLIAFGYPKELIIDALRVSGNNEKVARELLNGGKEIGPDDQGLDRNSPVISAIMASPVIQLALPKPKTLLALMMLYESPNNANMWLSDPDTHPVVSQILRIYHAEKHSLNHNRPAVPSSTASLTTTTTNSSPSFARSNAHPRIISNSTTLFPARTEGQLYQQYPGIPPSLHLPERNSSTPNLTAELQNVSWLPANSVSHSMRGSSANSISTVTQHMSNPSSPAIVNPSSYVNSVEPMSHSGSPVRGMTAIRVASSVPNGGSQHLMENLSCPSPTIPNISTDVEMDETGQEFQEMEM